MGENGGAPVSRRDAGAPPRPHGGKTAPGKAAIRGAAPRLKTRTPSGPGPFRPASPDLVTIYGAHAVRAALTAGRRKLLTLYATETALPRIDALARAAGLTPRLVEGRDLDAWLGPEAVHQGVMLEARPLPEFDIADIEPRNGIVLVLDQITDPHNVGAILRTACAFAVDALIITERHSPALTGVLAKAASGALEHVPIAPVVNLARALDQLRDRGYATLGLDSDGAAPLETLPLRPPLALVLGAEGKGLRRLTRERCDAVARLDLPGPIRSLNVSNACAAALAVVGLRLRAAP